MGEGRRGQLSVEDANGLKANGWGTTLTGRRRRVRGLRRPQLGRRTRPQEQVPRRRRTPPPQEHFDHWGRYVGGAESAGRGGQPTTIERTTCEGYE